MFLLSAPVPFHAAQPNPALKLAPFDRLDGAFGAPLNFTVCTKERPMVAVKIEKSPIPIVWSDTPTHKAQFPGIRL